MNVISFLKETREELAKVVWPTKEQTARLTAMVIVVTLAIGFLLGGVDFLLTQLTSFLLNR